jgi:hypothetical protein
MIIFPSCRPIRWQTIKRPVCYPASSPGTIKFRRLMRRRLAVEGASCKVPMAARNQRQHAGTGIYRSTQGSSTPEYPRSWNYRPARTTTRRRHINMRGVLRPLHTSAKWHAAQLMVCGVEANVHCYSRRIGRMIYRPISGSGDGGRVS